MRRVSYGFPGVGSIVAQSAQAATQLHQNTVSKTYNSYKGKTTSFSTQTTFDDIVNSTASSMNIYSYRVKTGRQADDRDRPEQRFVCRRTSSPATTTSRSFSYRWHAVPRLGLS